MRLISIQVGKPQMYRSVGPHGREREWTSGIFKTPVTGRVNVSFTQIEGDGQADLTVHGGVDKAILFYSADHYPAWRAELDDPAMTYGAFGENFTVADVDETDICLGDIWRTKDLVLEISQPREPCWKLAKKLGRNDVPQRVVDTGRGGWYARVLTEGSIQAPDTFERITCPNPDWPIARMNDVIYGRLIDDATLHSLNEAHGLAANWQRLLAKRLGA